MSAIASNAPPRLLAALGHQIRWQLLSALARSDRRVSELVVRVRRPVNLVSYHLRRLRELSLVRSHRSSADQRDLYYSLDLPRLHAALFAAGEELHPALGAAQPESGDESNAESSAPIRVLFLCTHNSARSQMAEALLRQLAPGRVRVESAGTVATRVHPLAIRVMAEEGIDLSSHRSKHLDEFLGERFDFVITVCDSARESCPIFPGSPERIHWSIPDPSAVEGSEANRLKAFRLAARELRQRLQYLSSQLRRRSK